MAMEMREFGSGGVRAGESGGGESRAGLVWTRPLESLGPHDRDLGGPEY